MPSNMPLPFTNGRPATSAATARAGYTAPTSSRNSPTSSYHNSPSGSSSGGNSKLLSSILMPPDEASDAVLEKHRLANRAAGKRRLFPPFLDRFFSPYPVALPFTARRLLVPLPNVLHPHPTTPIIPPHYRSNHPRHAKRNGFGKGAERSLRTTLLYGLGLVFIVLLAFSRIRSAIRNSARNIPLPFQDPSTLVLSEEEIKRIWEWEISQGHYPSSRRLPTTVRLHRLGNPGLPSKDARIVETGSVSPKVAHFGDVAFAGDEHGSNGGKAYPNGQLRAPSTFLDDVIPIGPQRNYLNLSTPRPALPSWHEKPSPYPPRPKPDTILDLDAIMDYCDFATNQYVRDCLEILRVGAGLDPHKRVRRGDTARWRHVYQVVKKRISQGGEPRWPNEERLKARGDSEMLSEDAMREANYRPDDVMELIRSEEYPAHLRDLQKREQQRVLKSTQEIESTTGGVLKPQVPPHPTHPTADPTCDPDYPKLFHIFWAGPFTDKPYLALSSFLFTQNLGLHLPGSPLEHRTGPRTTHYPASSFPDIEDGDEGLFGHSRRHNDPEGQHGRTDLLRKVCRPQMWVWINPGPAAAVPNPNARGEMLAELEKNPWSAPFLHPRFKEVIKFQMWNTTEQLDGVPELRDYWRDLPLFNSGGVKYGSAGGGSKKNTEEEEGKKGKEAELAEKKNPVTIGVTVAESEARRALDPDGDGRGERPDVIEEEFGRFGNHTRGEAAVAEDMTATVAAAPGATNAAGQTLSDLGSKSPIAPAQPQKKGEDELYERVGSTSSKGYDRLSVVLSDMARFVLCHRFGGIYLDADTILLRDWEELWGWKGQFAYRWSRLEKYNTAVLKLHRHSAIGSFLFKTALANGLDFHPMTISRYTKDAYLEGLLLRLPDALFDSAWLNTEYYQRDRPPFPYFKRFEDFFDPPKESDAGPAAIGFDGFFRGAFSYHFHNFWWIPFDPSRNWPDLGPRFAHGERVARAKVLAAKMATSAPAPTPSAFKSSWAKDTGYGKPAIPAQGGAAATAGWHNVNNGGRPRIKTVKDWEEELIGTVKLDQDDAVDDERDLGWATVLKRTFESFLRGERPNMYGEWLDWYDGMSDGA